MLRMLVPVDGSENSLRAVEYVAESRALYREPPEIHLLNVQAPVASGTVKRFISQEELNRYHHDEGALALAPARAVLDRAQIPYICHIGVGEIAPIILRYARETACGMIVMGTRGLGAVTGLLLGSNAAKVVHSSDLPVLLVK